MVLDRNLYSGANGGTPFVPTTASTGDYPTSGVNPASIIYHDNQHPTIGTANPSLPSPGVPMVKDTGTGSNDDNSGFAGYSAPGFDAGDGPAYHFTDAPRFTPTRFQAPTEAQAQAEPGYQFRLDSGEKALQNAAAAKGVLRTGGTLRDIVGYGQNFAAQEYNNVFDRAMKAYGLNYQGEKDSFDPRFQEWAFLSAAEKARALAAYQQRFDAYSLGANLSNQQSMLGQQIVANAIPNGATPVAPPTYPGT